MSYVPRLKTKYHEEVAPQLMEKFGYKSPMQIPRLLKISVNQGVGAATQDKKLVDVAVEEMSRITGQRAVPTMAKKSVSNFKLREEMPIGARVTLRGNQMYEFDGRGNFTMGVTEQIIFPEVDIDKISKVTGMDITFVTSAQTDAEAFELLKSMGFPFKK
jgi:large subunit ribosomal protein L5